MPTSPGRTRTPLASLPVSLWAWVRDLWKYVDFRLRQRAQKKRNAKQDSNVYPLW